MRRIAVIVTLLFFVLSLAFCAGAAPAAKSIHAYGTVSTDGSCQMTMTVTIRLDQPADDLLFPLPASAGNIMLNGSHVFSRAEGDLRYVNLSGVIGKAAGEFILTFTYSLPNLIATNEAGLLQLQLPLLSGFAYPVQALDFSVTMPGPVSAKPAFSSGYHQANIEKDLYFAVSGATVSGNSLVELKDHETLVMTLDVTEQMFPQNRIDPPDFQTMHVIIAVFSVLAIVYYILFLRNLPAWPFTRPTPPEGVTAGELCSILHLKGADLSMMVFSWAQLGYLLIRLDHSGRVTLLKQMDMGNERGSFEQRCFKLLFGGRNMVDTSSLRYVSVCRQVNRLKPSLPSFIHPKSGNLQVFRGLAAASGLFCSVCVGIALSSSAALQWLMVIFIGAFGLVSSWYMQSWAFCIFSYNKRPGWVALGFSCIWLLLSASANALPMGMGMVFGQLFAGLLLAFGGRRTPAGKQVIGEIIGHRRYLKQVKPAEIRFICQNNPDYFHQLAPYAIALCADKAFAKQFGNMPIGPCPYLSIGTDSTMRATQWAGIMRRTLHAMNMRANRSGLERFLRIIQSFVK